MENQPDNKVLGIPVEKYANLCYMLLLVSAGIGLLSNILGLVGVYIPGSGMVGLIGLVGLVLSLLGLFVFKDQFSKLDVSHFKYIGVLFVAFFVVGLVLITALGGFGVLGLLIILLLSIAQFVLYFAGFKNYKAGIEPTKDTIQATIKSKFKV